jgi:cytoskeletal protein RodZ
MNKNVLYLIILIMLISLVSVGLILNQEDNNSTNDNVETTASTAALPEERNSQSMPIDETSTPVDEAQPIEEITLMAVNGYDATGTATRTISGEYIHSVIAQMDEPAEGKFYEGWIVGPTVVSTGKLVQEVPGEWSLVFSDGENYERHTQVVITEETEANGLDNIPETHVLEGQF